jgi:hypothetical protein
MDLVLDIKEKELNDVKAPSLPTMTSGNGNGNTGFPAHKKRNRPSSAFKQQRQSPTAATTSSKAPGTKVEESTNPAADERRKIDIENTARIQSMSQHEIEEAQEEILNAIDPSILQMLLRRANLDDAGATNKSKDPFAVTATPPPPAELPTISGDDTTETQPLAEPDTPPKTRPRKRVTFDEDAAPPEPPADVLPPGSQPPSNKDTHTHDLDDNTTSSTTHFPAPPSKPDLDPSDPDFLANLHEKYFPSLPSDPAKLAWMAPIPTANSPADLDSPYHPGQSALPVSAIRFDFRGRLIPPRLARRIPASAGLHHHAEAPEAAGYTIPELARLARSAVPAQRCIAYQTLGRLLYRLGRGEWGVGEGGRGGDEDDLAFGIWRLVRAGYVLESLEEAAGVEEGVGHRGARAYAIEALWLYEKGGWKEKWRGL